MMTTNHQTKSRDKRLFRICRFFIRLSSGGDFEQTPWLDRDLFELARILLFPLCVYVCVCMILDDPVEQLAGRRMTRTMAREMGDGIPPRF